MLSAAYPLGPGYKDPETSHLAAQRIAPCVGSLQEQCLHALKGHATDGATADEVADELGRSILSIRPRFSELLRQGLIVSAGSRRPNQSGCMAKVWRAQSL